MFVCKNCGKEFLEKYSKWSNGDFCCKECARSFSTKNKRTEINKKVSKKLQSYYKDNPLPKGFSGFHNKKANTSKKEKWICPICGKELYLYPSECKKRKFCSGNCRNIYNNKFINGSRSKAEIELYNRLCQEYKQWTIIQNDRKMLDGLELDIYIPNINFAIEWNGIYHYKNIRENLLEKTQEKDKRKVKKCSELNIDLYVIKDLVSSKKFIDKSISNIIEYINKIYIGV